MTTKKRINTKDLIPIRKAYELLGEGWSRWSIVRMISRGDLVEGVHYIDDSPPSSSRRKLKLILPAIEEWRGTLSYKR